MKASDAIRFEIIRRGKQLQELMAVLRATGKDNRFFVRAYSWSVSCAFRQTLYANATRGWT